LYADIPQFANDYLNYMETIKNQSTNSIREYYYDIRLFFEFMKRLKSASATIDLIKSINLSDLYEYMAYLTHDRKLSSTSRCRKIASIRAFFKYLTKKAKLIDVDVSLELEKPKLQKVLPKHLSLEDSQNLLATVYGKHEIRDYAIITLFLNCGLRLSELVGIDLRKIKGDTLTILGKGNKERTVYLNDACLKAIESYLNVRSTKGNKDALFLSERGKRISNQMVQYLVKKNMNKSGIGKEYSTHKLRHTAATLMYKHGGVDIRALQEILGHTSIEMTQRYTHVDKEQLRDATLRNPLSSSRRVCL